MKEKVTDIKDKKEKKEKKEKREKKEKEEKEKEEKAQKEKAEQERKDYEAKLVSALSDAEKGKLEEFKGRVKKEIIDEGLLKDEREHLLEWLGARRGIGESLFTSLARFAVSFLLGDQSIP